MNYFKKKLIFFIPMKIIFHSYSYPKDSWYSLLNAALLLREQSLYLFSKRLRFDAAGVTERSSSRRILTPGSFYYVEKLPLSQYSKGATSLRYTGPGGARTQDLQDAKREHYHLATATGCSSISRMHLLRMESCQILSTIVQDAIIYHLLVLY
jgi:hypothetical protein